jgi:hypothetical protein
MEDELRNLRNELEDARLQIASLRIKATTTLSGAEFLTLIFLAPVVAAFVILGITIVWRTTSNPAEIAPHLDILLVAFSIFSNPVSAALGAVVGRFAEEKKRSDAD